MHGLTISNGSSAEFDVGWKHSELLYVNFESIDSYRGDAYFDNLREVNAYDKQITLNINAREITRIERHSQNEAMLTLRLTAEWGKVFLYDFDWFFLLRIGS